MIFYLFFAIIVIYFWINTRKFNETIVNESIAVYYDNQELKLNHISPLKLKEKIQYGIPIINYYTFYVLFSNFTPYPIMINRKVEVADIDGNEYLKYLEISISKNTAQQLKEFDSYEI